MSSRSFFSPASIFCALLFVVLISSTGMSTAVSAAQESANGPFLATGVRVGEVTPSSAVVWARLTKDEKPNRKGYDFRGRSNKNKKKPKKLWKLWGSCPGTPGQLRVRYAANEALDDAKSTDWAAVDETSDFAHQFSISDLPPATWIYYEVETANPGSEKVSASFAGRFRTAPPKDKAAKVLFTVVTGQGHRDITHNNGYQIYRSMRDLKPDFMVPTGDTVYLDSDWPRTTTLDLAKYHWQRAGSLPRHIKFWRQTPGYWMKDDHDIFANDCWPTLRMRASEPFTFKEGVQLFDDQTPTSEKPYRTFRWGTDLQIWLLESREYRMPNDMPDGPEKTLWGKEQKAWFKKTFAESDAIWKVVLSPTPFIGPPREGKFDNHSSAFLYEGSEVKYMLAEQDPKKVFVICGDIHYQYHSVDTETKVQEFSCGPASNSHAGGSSGKKKQHRFVRVGGGFLSVAVEPERDQSTIRLKFHTVNGKVKYEHTETVQRNNE